MTENEFDNVKGIVFNNIVLLANTLERLPTHDEFKKFASRVRQALPILCPAIKVSDAEFKKILRAIRAGLTVQMEGEEVFIEEPIGHKKWLNVAKSEIDWFFWTRYERYLRIDKNWSPTLTAALNTTSDRILDLMGAPRSKETFSRRGLVIGEVQSGKIANYTALCAKTADAGYKIIIVLTGILEDLRRQTQARLDLELAGRESQIFLSKADTTIKNKAVGVAKYDIKKEIPQFTSVISDFKATTLDSFSLSLKSLNNTVLFVVKKNKRILENLIAWLKNSVEFGKGKIEYPLLFLDDEADNASVNTNDTDADPTAINNCIRTILSLFNQTTYIGVTATPFANIFINPFDEYGMLNDDLFPRDFIYVLDVPSNYIGADAIFDGKYKNMLVSIQPENNPDVELYFPKKHKIDLVVKSLPGSLCEAMDYFLLVNAIRDLRSETKTHRTMLIHVSRFKSVHAQIYDLVNVRLNEIVTHLRAYSAQSVVKAESESFYIKNLHRVWDKYSLEKISGVSWEKILREYLRKAVEPIEVGLRNSDAKNSFNYEQNPDGLRVIAIGGNSFTRGLTLEGLCVTYFYRNSKTYDTLMQMGRWFGYRPNYDDLCRVWTSREIIDWYGYITDVSNELKKEISVMARYNKTPKDFGLKVRRHPDTLEITARNKMRYGVATRRPVELNKIFIETPRLIYDADVLAKNKALLLAFINSLSNFTKIADKNLWREIPKEYVAELVAKFKVSVWQRKFQGQPLREYILTKMDDKLWDVFIPEGTGDNYEELTVGGNQVVIKPILRNILINNEQIQISGTKLRAGSQGVTKNGLTEEQIAEIETDFRNLRGNKKISVPDNFYMIYGRNPLLVIYVIRPKSSELEVFFALGVGFPVLDPSISESQIKTAEFVINAVGNKEGVEE